MTHHSGGAATKPARLRTIRPAYGDSLSNAQVFDIVDNVLAWGGLVLAPSDCGYCLWALPSHPKGIALLDAVRQDDHTILPLSIGSQLMAAKLVHFNIVHQRLAAEAWPGPLTIVANVRSKEARTLSRNIRGGGETLGLRTSRSTIERQVATEGDIALISAAMYDDNGATINNYDQAHDLVLDRLLNTGLPPAPVLGIRVPSTSFVFARVSTVIKLDNQHRPVEIRPGDLDLRRLTAMTSRVAPAEYGDAT